MKPSIFTMLHIAALKLWPNCPKVRLTLRLIVRLFRGNFLVTGFLGAPQAKFFLPKSGFVGQNSGRSAVRCFPNCPTFYVKPHLTRCSSRGMILIKKNKYNFSQSKWSPFHTAQNRFFYLHFCVSLFPADPTRRIRACYAQGEIFMSRSRQTSY